jgi:CRISPR-associated exonuclease Cas4
MTFSFLVGVILIIIAILFIIISRRLRRDITVLKRQYNIQEGKIVYADLNTPAEPLFSKRYHITGKPDYVVQKNHHLIPVEIKTGCYNEPQKNHIFQLAAYCHLLEENHGDFVPYGLLVYGDGSKVFRIPFGPTTRFQLESTIKSMWHIMRTGEISRNHDEISRCKNCSMSTYCHLKIS